MNTFEITYVHWLLIYAGLIFHILEKLKKAKEKESKKIIVFSWRVFYQKNWANIAWNLFGLTIIMFLLDEWVGIIELSGDAGASKLTMLLNYLGKTVVFVFGYFGASSLKFIINIFKTIGTFIYEKTIKRFTIKK